MDAATTETEERGDAPTSEVVDSAQRTRGEERTRREEEADEERERVTRRGRGEDARHGGAPGRRARAGHGGAEDAPATATAAAELAPARTTGARRRRDTREPEEATSAEALPDHASRATADAPQEPKEGARAAPPPDDVRRGTEDARAGAATFATLTAPPQPATPRARPATDSGAARTVLPTAAARSAPDTPMTFRQKLASWAGHHKSLSLRLEGSRGVLSAYSVFGVPATKAVRVVRRDARTGDVLVTDGAQIFMVKAQCVCAEDALGRRRLEIIQSVFARVSNGDFRGAREILSNMITVLL